ncbi:MAG: molybdopterin biosynthesis protein MoeB [Acetobacterium sp. MES1]|jgi:molybdopterin/thiamine biosynthesis adenylyltransferase|uniref:HesA/MoeB/ThiF family protein n=1 Tax=unclassified Acetobacterium TaxID=2638182 RepID=UPI000B9CD484|nr:MULTISPECIES: HesA/MoeB/ThiF family protein [unclassified Acetobacterium]OXS25847.1 MAG: molybdopterin biosynthesis protein MoeB [Acetobacterium sp. MES1]
MSRYERNFPAFSEQDFERIQRATICIVGCGGLGGYIIEMLARVGIGSLILIDGDVFEDSNQNRQIFSTEKNIGTPKAKAAAARVKLINKEVTTTYYHDFLDEENGFSLIGDADLVMDALDNVPARLTLQTLCKEKNIPLIHGAIGGWFAQITTVFPEDDTLSRLYDGEKEYDSKALGNPSFTPALAASLQVSEALKVLTGKEEILRNKLLYIDLLANDFFTFNI